MSGPFGLPAGTCSRGRASAIYPGFLHRRTSCNGPCTEPESGELLELSDVVFDGEERQRGPDLPQRLLAERVARNPGVEPDHAPPVPSRRRFCRVFVRPVDPAEVDRPLLLVGVDDDVAGLRVDHEADEDSRPGRDGARVLAGIGGVQLGLEGVAVVDELADVVVDRVPAERDEALVDEVDLGPVVVDSPPVHGGELNPVADLASVWTGHGCWLSRTTRRPPPSWPTT